MNLIEQLGGYNAAKAEANAPVKLMNSFSYEQLDKELLEYRRENNIFEVGDVVVYPHLSHERLFSVRYVGGDQIVVYELWDEMGAKTFTEFHPYSDIRHATDAEIKTGHRISHATDNLSHFDHCSDIANHISPNTKVFER